MSRNIQLVSGPWDKLKQHVKPIRQTVFIDEQHVPVELEWDDEDDTALHFAALIDTQICIGCGRLTTSGHIGRLAVIEPYRGSGTGKLIMQNILSAASDLNMHTLVLNAQIHALTFYAQFGFTAHGEIFDDAGIPHRTMFLKNT